MVSPKTGGKPLWGHAPGNKLHNKQGSRDHAVASLAPAKAWQLLSIGTLPPLVQPEIKS